MTMAEGDYRRRSGEPHSFGAKWTDCSPPSLAPTAGECCESVALWEGGDERRQSKGMHGDGVGWRQSRWMDRHKLWFRVFVCPDLMHREFNPASWGVGIISASLSLPGAGPSPYLAIPSVAAPLLQSHRTSLAVCLSSGACGLSSVCCVIRAGGEDFLLSVGRGGAAVAAVPAAAGGGGRE